MKKEDCDRMIKNRVPIISGIFKLWELIECNFTQKTTDANKRYGTRKYPRYDGGKVVGQSFLEQQNLTYLIPKGLMYPLLGAFRALVCCKDYKYSWKKSVLDALNALGSKLTGIILDEKMGNPDVIVKNNNLWSNLLNEIYLYG